MLTFVERCFLFVVIFALQGPDTGTGETIVANVHENVSFVYHLYRHRFLDATLKTTHPNLRLAEIYDEELIRYYRQYPYPVTVEAYVSPDYVNISVFLTDVIEEQSNVYSIESPFTSTYTPNSWTLYVVDRRKQETTLTSGTSVYMNEYSLLKPETLTRMNLSMSLFFDGHLISSQYSYMFVHQQMNNKALVYEISDENGNRTNVTSVLYVVYLSVVKFEPRTTAYLLMMKDDIPSVTCTPECSPQCEVIWEKDGEMVAESPTLNLGEANLDTAGEYICIVTNNYTGHQLSRSLYIFVQDDREVSQLWVFVSVLCAALVLTIVALIVALICIGRRCLGTVTHETSSTKTTRKRIPRSKPKSTQEAHGMDTTDGCYETKQSSMGNEHEYCDMELKPDGNTVAYQNTAMVDDQATEEMYEMPVHQA